ncbi:MAG TPA: hypothetical protein ENJ95_09035 [Bacteroidetes bacterium]|nr:hypothetical protein [Bacteroidota bacterium]
MPACQKNYNFYILNSSSQQVRDLALSSDAKSLEIIRTVGGTTECTYGIDSSTFQGLQLSADTLQIVDEISGLGKTLEMSASEAKIRVAIQDGTGALELIGSDDFILGLQANIRYDAATDKVIIHY